MTAKILASEIKSAGINDFHAEAARHAVEMKNWRAHQKRVEDDSKNGVPKAQAHWPHPRPRAHSLVERAVDETDSASFEIVDDGPTADEILEKRKAELSMAVSHLEQKAIEAVVPQGKRRLFNIRENDIRVADNKRRADIKEKNKSLLKKLVGPSFEEIEAQVEASRPPEDTKHLADQLARARRIDDITRLAAQAYHDIEDLTVETIDSWKMPTF